MSLIDDLTELIDRSVAPGPDYIDLAATDYVDDAAFKARMFFQERPDAHVVGLRVDGELVGATTRKLVHDGERSAGGAESGAGAAGAGTPGAGERFVLVGDSTQYRLLIFRCRGCATEHYRTHHDERQVPTCDCAGGVPQQMELMIQ